MLGKFLARLAGAVLFCTASAEAGWTDIADPVFVNHQTEGGLPKTTVSALAQDSDGFLWVGTQNGLARWDGYRARLYQPNRADPGALPDSYVLGLHVDQGGRLWVATSAGGLARYEPAEDGFVPTLGLSSPAVSAIEDDGAGGLWVGTDIALDHLGADGKALAPLHPGGDNRIRALLRDGRILWIGTEHGLYRLESGASEPVQVPGIDIPIYSLQKDSQGRIWIGTRKKGVLLMAPGAPAPTMFAATASDWIISMAEAPSGEMWLASYGGGLIVADRAATSIRRIRHDPARASSLADDTLWAVLRDRSGLMWVGGNGGLTHTDPGQGGLLNIFGAESGKAALSATEVWSSLQASDGKVWIGLVRNGIDILDPEGRPAGALRPDPQRPDTALPDTMVISLAETGGGTIWVGTYLGLYRTDLSGKTLRRVALAPGMGRFAVNAVQDDGASIWFGSFQGGLWQMDPADERILRHETGERFTDGRVQTLAPAPGGRLWIGTRNGLNRLDPRSGEVLKIPAAPKDPAGLAGGFVTSMLTDRQGRLWVATFGGGISVLTGFDGEGRPRFRNLGHEQGLPNDNVGQILADRDGRIWAGTDDGIALIDPDSFAIRTFQSAQGAVLSAITTSSGNRMTDGALMFGSLGGLLLVRPDALRVHGGGAPVAITDLTAGGRPVPAARYRDGADLVLEPGRNSLSAEFAALDFADPAKARFAYKLEGFDRGWTETDATRRLAAYTNLPPGSYVLRIRADGPATAALHVRVLPAWYQTWTARLLFAGLILASIALLVRIRTAHLRRRQRELQSLIDERTAELLEANRRLELISTTDRLTGAHNRLFLDTSLAGEYERSRRSGRPFSIVIIDMDKFKSVNDTYGHVVGDKVLVHLVEVLNANKRKTDILGRWGGEEFLVICPETPQAGAAELAEALRAAVEGSLFPEVGPKTISVGVAALNGSESLEELIGRADAALYSAKNGGRNKVVEAV